MIQGPFFNRLVLAGVIAASVTTVTPALAFDEGRGSAWEAVMGMFGLNDKKEVPFINYRERAPLVLPPRTDLRQPKPAAAARAPNWPQDQEIVASKKRAAELRTRTPRDETGMELVSARDLKATGRISAADRIENPSPAANPCSMDLDSPYKCDPGTYWKNLAVKSEGPQKGELVAGVEPERKYLTQPPKGYLKATRNVKPTFEPRVKEEEDPLDFFRKKPNRDE